MSTIRGPYDVYSGMGYHTEMTYRIHQISGLVEYRLTGYWHYSECPASHIRDKFPLVAKNVRFKT